MGVQGDVIYAFGEDHVAQLTGLSRGQLRAWDRRGFFVPHYAYENRTAAHSRVYSFQDVVGLRTIAVLLKEHRVSLQHLRKVAEELDNRGYKNWSDVRLHVLKGQVYFQKPEPADVEGVWDGRYTTLPVIRIIQDVESRVKEIQKRKKNQFGKIERSKFLLRNTPVLSGTRIPTSAIRQFHEAGYSESQILKEYPSLTPGDVAAALKYEKRLAKSA